MRVGRPPLGDKKRDRVIRVRLTQTEYQRVLAFLADKGVTPAKWFRDKGMEDIP